MNKYTDPTHFTEKPEHILTHCPFLVPNNCIIHNHILYERLTSSPDPEKRNHKYRFFFNSDNYDYLENPELEKKLEQLIVCQNCLASKEEGCSCSEEEYVNGCNIIPFKR